MKPEGPRSRQRPTAARSSARSISPSIMPTMAPRSRKSCSSGARCRVQTWTGAAGGSCPFLEQLYNAGFAAPGRTDRLHVFRREPRRHAGRPPHCGGPVTAAWTTYQAVGDAFSKTLLAQYNARYPGVEQFTGGGSGCSGLSRHEAVGSRRARPAGYAPPGRG